MLYQPGLERRLIKNRRCCFDKLKNVAVIANAGVELGAGVAVIETAVIKRVDLPVSHFIRPAPRDRTGGGRDMLALQAASKVAVLSTALLDVIASPQWITGVGKAELKIHH